MMLTQLVIDHEAYFGRQIQEGGLLVVHFGYGSQQRGGTLRQKKVRACVADGFIYRAEF
jgi:hypothetical protein